MINVRHLLNIVLCAAAIFLSGCASQGIPKETINIQAEQVIPEHTQQYKDADHILDGTSFEYFYDDGSGLSIAFYEGMLKYEWIVGPRKGNKAKDILYQTRKIGDDMYLLNWHEANKPDFVSLIINLKKQALYSSAILRYGTSNEMIHFKEATIKNVKRPL